MTQENEQFEGEEAAERFKEALKTVLSVPKEVLLNNRTEGKEAKESPKAKD
jgi:hypothetical protein